MSKKESILIVEDEPRLLRLLEINLQSQFDVTTVSNGTEALSKIQKESFDAILSDIRLPGASGMDILKASIRKDPEIPVILVTAFGTVENAVEAMKIGAFDYLVKPVKIKELKMVLERAFQFRALRRENRELRKTIRSLRMKLPEFITVNPRMQAILKRVRDVAPTGATVLIQGKSGTGKELIAQMIHQLSDRSDGPFVPVNCAAIPQDLLESELFGHERGAFTGAVHQKKGKFELANGGTFFLDEIAELPLNLQAKLLRVLETHQVSRVGGTQTLDVDVRVIAATNRDLQKLVREGGFREDLFYRLNVVKISLPELRERPDDIPVLVDYFLRKYREELKKDVTSVSPEAQRVLMQYPWPGNVRELENVVYRAVLFVEGTEIRPEHLPEELRAGGHESGHDIPQTKDELLAAKKKLKQEVIQALEKRFLENALQDNEWNISRTARAVGMDRRQLQNMIRRHKIAFPSIKE
ncbi:MAG: sigma-54-dependent Fis family transcriptional regulator [Calditrichaeota bacterium]|nr:sigma-54-dependent Fis family transcriptional regulator [Calditrichota bacterium]